MPILPTPVDDEFILGYIGRLTRLNLLSSPIETMRSLVVHFNLDKEDMPYRRHYYQAERYLQALSLASGKSLSELLFYHSNFPAEGLTPEAGALWLHWQMRRTKGKRQRERKRPHLCRECIPQQAADYGFAFWKRQHQLDGVYWCPIHKTALLAVDDWLTKDAWIPNASVAALHTSSAATDFERYPTLQIFCETMIGFLRSPLWRSVARIEEYLARWAIEQGACPRGDGFPNGVPDNSELLIRIAFSECPAWWLNEVFGLQKATNTTGHLSLNSVLLGSRHAPAACYALAIAMLLSPQERADIFAG